MNDVTVIDRFLPRQSDCRAAIGGFIEAGRDRRQVGQRLVLIRPGRAE